MSQHYHIIIQKSLQNGYWLLIDKLNFDQFCIVVNTNGHNF